MTRQKPKSKPGEKAEMKAEKVKAAVVKQEPVPYRAETKAQLSKAKPSPKLPATPSVESGNGSRDREERQRTVIPTAPTLYRRTKPARPEEDESPPPPVPVSAGPLDKITDYAFNPTKEKLREVTIIDRLQGRLFPQLDAVVSTLTHYVIEIAHYRQDKDEYRRLFKREKPVSPDVIDELLYRTAQWQKSIGGTNLGRATDMALAEIESRNEEMSGANAADAWKE